MVIVFYAGYGVFAEQEFKKGDFIVEYTGDLITNEEAARREAEYETEDVGCFMYYFVHKGTNVVSTTLYYSSIVR